MSSIGIDEEDDRPAKVALTEKQRLGLEVVAAGDAFIEGHATEHDDGAHGGLLNEGTAQVLERLGLIDTYLGPGRVDPPWMARITDAGLEILADGGDVRS